MDRPLLYPEQEKVLESKSYNILVEAGPATGKTRLIHAFAHHLVFDRKVDPSQIMVVNNTVWTRKVHQKRFGELGVGTRTIHSLCFRDSEAAREAFIDSENFEDLLLPLSEGEKKYQWILVDEAQDLQETMYKAILSRAKKHFLVGDPWQCIFRFANANPRLMQFFKKDFCKSNDSYFTLNTNHRSAVSIVEQSNTYSGRHILPRDDAPQGQVEFVRNLFDLPDESYNVALGRNHSGLWDLSVLLKSKNIPHTLHSDNKSRTPDVPNLILTTIHAARGNEWNNVYLSSWPNTSYRDEERCCYYVGLTRAKLKLTITN